MKRSYLVGILIVLITGIVTVGIRSYFHQQEKKKAAEQVRKNISLTTGNPFIVTVENKNARPSSVPKDMVYIPGGTFSMGTDRAWESLCDMPGVTADATPIHRVYVDGFFMDEHEVTNAEFSKFVKATGYKTVAEQTPTQEEFPDALPEMLVAGSVVFSPPSEPVGLENYLNWWAFVKGANWKYPIGPLSNIKGNENLPAVQIAWEDAVAYAAWAGKRLPTEAEWEFAARGGLSGQLYAWGDEFKPNNQFMCNTFQGKFPTTNTREDGYSGVAPVKQFPSNGYGLYDMAGNVWEWCSDWYDYNYFKTFTPDEVALNPKGPVASHDPAEPGVFKKVHRGGSYLCTDQYCSRYMNGTRGKGDWRTGTNHVGFRCVKDIQ